jgi:hypothetical protein
LVKVIFGSEIGVVVGAIEGWGFAGGLVDALDAHRNFFLYSHHFGPSSRNETVNSIYKCP